MYLITTNTCAPFLTRYYQDDMFNIEVGMIVYDLITYQYTIDGLNWMDIEKDHL
jgi:hypothetical protein